MAKPSVAQLEELARARRADALELVYRARSGHIGGDLSAMDILTCLYYRVLNVRPEQPDWPERDRFLLSKGHSVESYYAVLAARGFFEPALLATYGRPGSEFIGHPNRKIPGIEMNTGSLGHGLPIGVGCALAAQRDGRAYRTFVLMGDGELAEGSVWEAAMAGAHYRLGRLCAIIDRNGLQISGPTEDVMALGDLAGKWRAFGWDVSEIDGNDMAQLVAALERDAAPVAPPRCIIAHTTKGRGVSFMEGRPEWHHKVPSPEQYAQALRELGREAD